MTTSRISKRIWTFEKKDLECLILKLWLIVMRINIWSSLFVMQML